MSKSPPAAIDILPISNLPSFSSSSFKIAEIWSDFMVLNEPPSSRLMNTGASVSLACVPMALDWGVQGGGDRAGWAWTRALSLSLFAGGLHFVGFRE